MKTYHARNVSAQETLEGLDKDRNQAVASGSKTDLEVADYIKVAQDYKKRLETNEKTAEGTSRQGKAVSSLWQRISTGVSGESHESSLDEQKSNVAKPMKMPKTLKLNAKRYKKRNMPHKAKGGKLSDKVKSSHKKTVASKKSAPKKPKSSPKKQKKRSICEKRDESS